MVHNSMAFKCAANACVMAHIDDNFGLTGGFGVPYAKLKDRSYSTNLPRTVGGLPARRKSLSGGRMKCGASSLCGLQLVASPM